MMYMSYFYNQEKMRTFPYLNIILIKATEVRYIQAPMLNEAFPTTSTLTIVSYWFAREGQQILFQKKIPQRPESLGPLQAL